VGALEGEVLAGSDLANNIVGLLLQMARLLDELV
jgi:hypothetical protein